MADTIKVSEMFFSKQGEGKYVGVDSIFIRTFGCNFRCKGFGLPVGHETEEVTPIIKQHKKNPYTEINNMPTVATGCDTYFSIYPAFRKLSKDLTVKQITTKVLDLDTNNEPSHVVITGGEPLLGWQRQYAELLTALIENGYRHITFETNGTQKLNTEFKKYLKSLPPEIDITFSVSPKLAISGEKTEKALKSEIVNEYTKYGFVYLKFVVVNEDDIKEVNSFVAKYKDAGFECDVYLMPCGGKEEMYYKNKTVVQDLANKYNYTYSPRLHIDLFGNAHGS